MCYAYFEKSVFLYLTNKRLISPLLDLAPNIYLGQAQRKQRQKKCFLLKIHVLLFFQGKKPSD